MVMRTVKLRGYLEKLKDPEFDHIRTIRIGTKSLTFWPFRYLTDPDAQDLLALIKELVDAGKHVSIMAHINHKQELRTAATREAIALLRKTGAQIRTQAPLLNNINTDPNMWAEMWKEQTQLGMIPYYMFIERDTGAAVLNYHFIKRESKAINRYPASVAPCPAHLWVRSGR